VRVKRLRFLAVLLFCTSVVPVCSGGDIIYVATSGPNDPGTGTFNDPFRRIQYGIDAAADGDVVKIRPGVYSGAGNYDLDPNGLGIIICSIDPNDPNIVSNTIIDPNEQGRGFYFHKGEDASCVVSGLTIKRGFAVDQSGGAIVCTNDSGPTIKNCVIKNNKAAWYGGAVFLNGGTVSITNCKLTSNSAQDGGALECWSGMAVLKNCIVSKNEVTDNGGGIDCYYVGQVELQNCAIIKNLADSGGGLYCVDDGSATIKNSIFWSNDAVEGAQIAIEYSPFCTSHVSVGYSDVQGGEAAVYDPCNGLVWDSNNIDTDPCFVSFNPNGDPNVWDFHLQSEYGRWDGGFYSIDFDEDGIVNLADFDVVAGMWMEDGDDLAADLNRDGTVDWLDIRIFGKYFLTAGLGGEWVADVFTSDCIDAGDPGSDWAGEPWPNGKRINMGAYGGTKQASKNGSPSDFDVSNNVDFVDYAALAEKWMSDCGCIEDLTGNGVVDFFDLEVFIREWLWQK